MYVCFLLDACKYRILASPLCNIASPMMHAALLTVSTSSIAHIGGEGKIQPAGKLEIDIEEDGSSGQCASYTE